MTRAEYFVAAANALALAALEGWQGWPGGKMLLIGPTGAGKSHLAQIWADETGAALVGGDALATADIPELASAGRVVVEDAAAVADSGQAQTALFHLHNLLAQSGGALLLTAATPPRDWGLTLPDLLSRMQATPITRIDPPDDALLSAVLVKLFADRQLAVAPNLIPYLVARIPRSIGAARALVAALDAAALAEGRPITRTLAAGLLDSDADE
jgi:chromosomal replication initiation ATPase DnaA